MVLGCDSCLDYDPCMMTKIRDQREKLGLTQKRLAELVRTSPPQIRRLELGERKLTKEWAERIAPHLEISPQDLMFGDETPPQTAGTVRAVPVVGDVQAGHFLEIDDVRNDYFSSPTGETVASVDVPGVPASVQVAWNVIGDSMDLLCQDGGIAISVPIYQFDRDLREGQIVVVQRERGGLFEITVKQLSIQNGDYHLVPRSTNPSHKIIVISPDNQSDTETVQIIAVVIRFVTPSLI